MFDMRKVGKQIAQLRKEMKMTQMELAEQMGVSFQAVSNWERGETMPDISKLPDLSRIFQVEIDRILGGEKGTELIKKVMTNETEKLIEELKEPKEEFLNAAGVMKMEQADQVFKQLKEEITSQEMAVLAPFISQELIDEFAEKEFDRRGMSSLPAIAPFLGQEKIDAFVLKDFEPNGVSSLTQLAPFINQDLIHDCAKKIVQNEGIAGIAPICPFIEENVLHEMALEAISTKGLKEIVPILPFLDEKAFQSVLK